MAEAGKKSLFLIDDSAKFRLPIGVVFFHDLMVPKKFNEESAPRYGITLGIDPKADFSEYLQALATLQKHEKWPELLAFRNSAKEKALIAKGISEEKIKNCQKPIREAGAEDIARYPFYKGVLIAKASSTAGFPPVLVDAKRNRITSPEELTRGMEGVALVALGLNLSTGVISMRLKGFQKVAKGEPLGGGAPASVDEFESFEASESTVEDPFAMEV